MAQAHGLASHHWSLEKLLICRHGRGPKPSYRHKTAERLWRTCLDTQTSSLSSTDHPCWPCQKLWLSGRMWCTARCFAPDIFQGVDVQQRSCPPFLDLPGSHTDFLEEEEDLVRNAVWNKRSVHIFILYEWPFSIVFWEEEWFSGGPVGAKSPIFNRYSPVAPQP